MPSISEIIFIVALLFVTVWLALQIAKERCPECHQRVYFKFVERKKFNKSTDKILEKCNKCGFIKKRKVPHPYYADDAYTLAHKQID